jgi:hypothetical protein
MYTCQRALLRPRGENQRLIEAQVGNSYLRNLVTENSVAYLVLKHPAVSHELSINLFDILDTVYSVLDTVTVDDWLVSLGNSSLPTSDTVPKRQAGVAKFNDAFSAGFHVNRIHPTAGEGNEYPDEDLTDLLLTKPEMDYQLLYRNCLVNVNGLFHITDYSTRGLRVKDGGRSTYLANNHDIGLISFLDVGKVTVTPITEAMIKPKGTNPLKNGFIVNLPNIDLSKRIVMMSIGGFLHYGEQQYRVTGDHSIDVQWYNIPLAHRYYNSNKLIDLSKFDATMNRNPNHGDALDLNQANTDAAIKAYMTLSQSFVITIEANNLYYERHGIERTKLPGRYVAYERPRFPLQLENGLVPSYIAIVEDDLYSVAVTDNLVNRYVHDKRPRADDMYYNGARVSSERQKYASAYFLEFGTTYLA